MEILRGTSRTNQGSPDPVAEEVNVISANRKVRTVAGLRRERMIDLIDRMAFVDGLEFNS